jgi:hypothetical protein
MIGNNPLNRIICLDQQNAIVTFCDTHNSNCHPDWLTVNQKKTPSRCFVILIIIFDQYLLFAPNIPGFAKIPGRSVLACSLPDLLDVNDARPPNGDRTQRRWLAVRQPSKEREKTWGIHSTDRSIFELCDPREAD